MSKLILQHRRGDEDAWLDEQSPIPAEGELVVQTTEGDKSPVLKIGDGENKFADLPSVTKDVETAIQVETNRVDNLVALKEDAATTPFNSFESELTDIRNRYTGSVATCAGAAVRQIDNELQNLKHSVQDFVNKQAVDGLVYQGNMLWLTANGEQVGSAVGPISGGTGTGTGSDAKVSLHIESGRNQSIIQGTDVTLRFYFTSVLDGEFTGDFECIYTHSVNNRTKTYMTIYSQGGTIDPDTNKVTNPKIIEFPVQEYFKIEPGENTIKITCKDIDGNSREATIIITSIQMGIDFQFNPAKVYKQSEAQYFEEVKVNYKHLGSVDKNIYFRIYNTQKQQWDNLFTAPVKVSANTCAGGDNEQSFTVVIPHASSEGVNYQPGLRHGLNRIQIEAYGLDEITQEEIQELHYGPYQYDLLYSFISGTEAMLSANVSKTTIEKGEALVISYLAYLPQSDGCPVKIFIDGKERTSLVSTKVDSYESWATLDYPVPNTKDETKTFDVKVVADNSTAATVVIPVSVKLGDTNIEILQDDTLTLSLTAQNRVNSEIPTPAKWEYQDKHGKTRTTTFSNFNWMNDGWQPGESAADRCLRVSNGAIAQIEFDPFSAVEYNSEAGLTIELDFSVSNSNTRGINVIECLFGDIGFYCTPDTAYIKNIKTECKCNYKENQRTRLTFVIDPQSTEERESAELLSVYLNGVLSNVKKYTGDFLHPQDKAVAIKLGHSDATLDVYNVRVYNSNLTARQVVRNYIASVTDIDLRDKLFVENNLYKNNLISYDEVSKFIPTIIFKTADNHQLVSAGLPTHKLDDDEGSMYALMDFINPLDPTRNFSTWFKDKGWYEEPSGMNGVLVDINVQGTSSQYYVRKNWKIKLQHYIKGESIPKYQHMQNEIPTKTFCIKVDYAECTGTHNTQNANFVETLYTNKVPGAAEDSRVRSTIAGFPCVIFHEHNGTRTFYGKGNFNFDKGSKEAFGFNNNFVESWEFCNNTSDECKFEEFSELNPENKWIDIFEARYVPKTPISEEKQTRLNELFGSKAPTNYADAYDELEKLEKQLKNATDPTVVTQLTDQCIALRTCGILDNFKRVHDWVRTSNDEEFVSQFDQYFDREYMLVYYVYTFFALMVDQRAKNLFLTRWEETGKWYPYFYDNDTCFGINNEGALVYDYYHEDTDKDDNGANVYNGADSELWRKFARNFENEIRIKYNQLRNDKLIDYEKLEHQFIVEGSNRWNATIYNQDAEFKYVGMARPENAQFNEDGPLTEEDEANQIITTYLSQVRGDGSDHLRYFLANRIKYCDSKWFAESFQKNYVLMRVNTPEPVRHAIDLSQEFINDGTFVPTVDEQGLIHFGIKNVNASENNKFKDVEVSITYNSAEDSPQHLDRNTLNSNSELVVNAKVPEGVSVDQGVSISVRIFKTDDDDIGVVDTANFKFYRTTTNLNDEAIRRNEIIVRSTQAVPADPAITVIPYSKMYGTVKYKANGTPETHKISTKDEMTNGVVFGVGLNEKFNDTETAVYGASDISSLGDLSALYLSVLDVTSCGKLKELKVGNSTEGYQNLLLREAKVGTCPLLTYVDFTNCTGLGKEQTDLDLSKCLNIHEVYLTGTPLSAVLLPEAGSLTTVHLPSTIKELKITNQPFLTLDPMEQDASHNNLEVYNTETKDNLDLSNITSLTIEGCPQLLSLFDRWLQDSAAQETRYVVLDNVRWSKTVSELKSLYIDHGLRSDATSDKLNITGTCVVHPSEAAEEVTLTDDFGKSHTYKVIEGNDMQDVVTHYPFLTFTAAEGAIFRSDVSFHLEGTDIPTYVESVYSFNASGECNNPWLSKPDNYTDPVKPDTEEFVFTFHGQWSREQDPDKRTPQSDALLNIIGNRDLYPVFRTTTKQYPVTFKTSNTELYTVFIDYGSYVEFDPEAVEDKNLLDNNNTPKRGNTIRPDKYDFLEWNIDLPHQVMGSTVIDAVFSSPRLDRVTSEDIIYEVDSNNNIKITSYQPADETKVIIQIPDKIDEKTVISLADGAFSHTPVEYVVLPDSLQTIENSTFLGCTRLQYIYLGTGIKVLGTYYGTNSNRFANVFKDCTALEKVDYNITRLDSDGVSYIWEGCRSSTGFDVSIGNAVEVIPTRLFYNQTTIENTRLIRTLDFSKGANCTLVKQHAFMNADMLKIIWPTSFASTTVEFELDSFRGNSSITYLWIPEGVKTLGLNTFGYWEQLQEVHIPSTITSVSRSFEYCPAIKKFDVEEDNTEYLFYTKGDKSANSLVHVELGGGYTLVRGTSKSWLQNEEYIQAFGRGAFAGITDLTQLHIPSRITMLPVALFTDSGISEVIFEERKETQYLELESSCFAQCKNLKTLELPVTVTKISWQVFLGTSLKHLTINSEYKEDLFDKVPNGYYTQFDSVSDGAIIKFTNITYSQAQQMLGWDDLWCHGRTQGRIRFEFSDGYAVILNFNTAGEKVVEEIKPEVIEP